MIKKILIGGICMVSCLTLVGCGNSNQEAATTNLATQLDRLNNSVNSISNAGNYSLPELSSLTKDTSSYSDSYNRATQSIKEQESYRNAIKSKVSLIKNELGKDLKLGNQNLKTLRNLTSNLASETTSLNNTKSEYNASLKGVNKAIEGTDASTVSSKITRLSNCVDARTCYYNNILNTLSQIESILGISNSNGQNSNSLFNKTNISGISTTSNTDNSNNSNITNEALQQLLYNYLLNNLCPGGNCYNNQQNCPNGVCPPNGYYTNNYGANTPSTCPGTVNYPNNTVNSYNGIYNNGLNGSYNNGANGVYNNSTLNPDRNTDSYGPINKNIDTYRPGLNGTYENNGNFNQFNGQNGINNNYNNAYNTNLGSNNSRPVLNGDATMQTQTEPTSENKSDVKLYSNNDKTTNNSNNSNNETSITKTDSSNASRTNSQSLNNQNTTSKTDVNSQKKESNDSKSSNSSNINNTARNNNTNTNNSISRNSEQNRTSNSDLRKTINPMPSKIARPMPKTLQNDVAQEEPAKGHTNTASLLDTNKKIEDLVRGNLTETFDIQFMFCN